MEHGYYGNCIRQVLRRTLLPGRSRRHQPAALHDFMGILHTVFFILVGFFVLIVPAVAA